MHAFGYAREVECLTPLSVRVADGKHPDTLQPIVAIGYRFAENGPETTVQLTPDEADAMADLLHRMAARARAKHWQ